MIFNRTDGISNREWVDKDRVYEITGSAHGCTLYCEGCNIGSYTTSQISLKTLDVNRDWGAITEQLENLCGWLTESTLAS